ncbi:hypothetical protein ACFVT5_01880 [Streptomyces sp. NPDC058001]|uniref:hypothetical protein n=1 Tax=Streptomyces sp. NPDC058001 TaxID=3346300 RepID=UPI0036F0258A
MSDAGDGGIGGEEVGGEEVAGDGVGADRGVPEQRLPEGRSAEGRSAEGSAAEGLPEELRGLGRALARADTEAGTESMVERVLERILAGDLPAPVVLTEPPGPSGRARRWARGARRWARARRRALVAALCGLLTVLALTPPVRAAVADWFGFGGVRVRVDPSSAPTSGAVVPGCGRTLTLAEAGRRAGFAPVFPKALGTPDAVQVTGERGDRPLISLCWREAGGTIRLDEFPARLDTTFVKVTSQPVEWLELHPSGGGDEGDGGPGGFTNDLALWFATPHRLTFWMWDGQGDRWTRSERVAGPTLLWAHPGEGTRPNDGLTLRLEGVPSSGRALDIARSTPGVDRPGN